MGNCKSCIKNSDNRCKFHLDYEHEMHHGETIHDVLIVECTETCRAKERAMMKRETCYLCGIPLKKNDGDEEGVSDVKLSQNGKVLLDMCFICFSEAFKYTFQVMKEEFGETGWPDSIKEQQEDLAEKCAPK